jgi:hypothetical protein
MQLSAGQGGGVDQACDGWRGVPQFEFQQWVGSGHSLKPPEWRPCTNPEVQSGAQTHVSVVTD